MSLAVAQLHNVPGRILVISDVHAKPVFLEKLLEKAHFAPEDTLILLGDMMEKGPDSLVFLRQLMAFAQKNQNVKFVRGNCDDLPLDFVRGDGISPRGFWDYLGHHRESVLWQMGDAAGVHPRTIEELPLLRQAVAEGFAPELAFLAGWPVILESDHFVFVHGGVPSCKNMEQLSPWHCMKNDNFLDRDVALEKFCVVGHTPVTLYHPHVPRAAPIVCREKHIVSIDGGCGLKLDGQLNALIIPREDSEAFTHVAYDGLPVAVAEGGQRGSRRSVNVRWGKNRVEVLVPGPEFSTCRHVESGETLDILTDYLYEDRGVLRCEDATDYQLEVAPGDRIHLVRTTSRGVLAKKAGVTGWYHGGYRPL